MLKKFSKYLRVWLTRHDKKDIFGTKFIFPLQNLRQTVFAFLLLAQVKLYSPDNNCNHDYEGNGNIQ